MGFGRIGKLFKPVTTVVRGTGRAVRDNPEKLLVVAALGAGAAGGIVNPALAGAAIGSYLGLEGASSEMDRQAKQKKMAIQEAQNKASADVAEQTRLKALADESVKQQEEATRRRTIFGGESIDQQNQRKTLLGL